MRLYLLSLPRVHFHVFNFSKKSGISNAIFFFQKYFLGRKTVKGNWNKIARTQKCVYVH